jgi:hypothetical protein
MAQSPPWALLRSDVAGFFQPSIDCVVQAVVDQQSSAKAKISVRKFALRFSKHPINLPIERCPCWRFRSQRLALSTSERSSDDEGTCCDKTGKLCVSDH